MLERVLKAVVEETEMRQLAHHHASPRPAEHPMTVREQIFQSQMKNLVAARQRLEHKGERGVFVRQHALERVHYKGELRCHASAFPLQLIENAGRDTQGGECRGL